MRRIIKNNYKFIIGVIVGLIISVTSVYAVEAYIESKKVSYENKYTNKNNTQEAIDELYERSGIHKDKWVDPILNGADPVLKEPLIPVEIDNDGTVYYANLNSEWYNYSEKRWANAVILIDNPSNKNYKVGDHILEADIESYFVWIPRYQYKIWDLGQYSSYINFSNLKNNANYSSDDAAWKVAGSNARLIDIRFGVEYDKMNESEAKVGEYYTHPAFTLGDKKLNGLWVGKFETGGSTDSLIVKPDVLSLRNEKVKTFFDAAKGYETSLDSHMMKNTEWGAVAYLSHSKYGIGTKVNINNASDFKTGYGAAAGTDQTSSSGKTANSTDSTITKQWNKEEGYLASTTGNISGIYDMSGGAFEYVAGCIEGQPGDSEFDVATLAKYMQEGYIDKYDNNTSDNSYNKRILGDATGEMGPFYLFYDSDVFTRVHSRWYNTMVRVNYTSNPWFHRGGSIGYGVIASQFSSDYMTGGSNGMFSFRMVLAS